MTNPIADPGHGHSPAAWTAVVIMLVGVAAATVAFCFEQPTIVMVTSALIPIGLIVGWIMAKVGYGVKGPKYQPKAH